MKQPVIQGGLGNKDLQFFNEALLCKWLWRFLNEKGNLSRKVVTIKYGDEGSSWSPSTPTGSYGHRSLYQRARRLSPCFPYWSAMALPLFFGMIDGVVKPLSKSFSLIFLF